MGAVWAGSPLADIRGRPRCPPKAACPGSTIATGWLNSPPLTAEDVGGRVVLVDFWTYTCINWLRTSATFAPEPRSIATPD